MLEVDLAGARETAGDIVAESDRLDQWVRELLLSARDDGASPDAVDINGVIRQTLNGFVSTMDRQGIALSLDTQEQLPPVRGNPAPLGEAFNTLVANALEAMPRGGALAVVSQLHPGRRAVEVRITDTGKGLSRESAKKAFRPFFTTKRNGLGLGLGLARRIVERHGGSLKLASAEGRGTTAILRIPIAL